MQCIHPASRDVQNEYRAVKTKIQYAMFSCCWQCGLPQELCSRYERNKPHGPWVRVFNRDSQYLELVLPTYTALLAVDQRVSAATCQRMDEAMDLTGQEDDLTQTIYKWLAEKIRWGGMESNRLTEEFYRAIVLVDATHQGR